MEIRSDLGSGHLREDLEESRVLLKHLEALFPIRMVEGLLGVPGSPVVQDVADRDPVLLFCFVRGEVERFAYLAYETLERLRPPPDFVGCR